MARPNGRFPEGPALEAVLLEGRPDRPEQLERVMAERRGVAERLEVLGVEEPFLVEPLPLGPLPLVGPAGRVPGVEEGRELRVAPPAVAREDCLLRGGGGPLLALDPLDRVDRVEVVAEPFGGGAARQLLYELGGVSEVWWRGG